MPAAAVALAPTPPMIVICDSAAACDACERLSEAASVVRVCSRGVQLRMDVLTAAEHAAEAWEAAVTACLLRLWHLRPPLISVAIEPSHATLV